MTRRHDFDVVIAGGGPVGAGLAALLATAAETRELSIALIEPRPGHMPGAAAPLDLRVSALSHASRALLERVGAWPSVMRRGVCAYDRMMVWEAGAPVTGADTLCFDAAALGVADLGCIVENATMTAALLDSAVAAGVVMLTAPVTGLTLSPEHAEVVLGDRRLRASLVVAADGGDSGLRALAGLTGQGATYPQEAIVAHLAVQRPHECVARQRFLQTGPLALLPLADGRVSLVWSTTPAEAERLMALSPDRFADEVTRASDGLLGSLILASDRARFPLRRFQADSYVATRFALVGDAAHSVHPLAGQGVNQGFMDVEVLWREVAAARARGADIGDSRGLGRYGRERRADVALMGGALDAIARWSAGDAPWSRRVGRAGLGLVNRLAPLKRALAARALGI